MSVSEFIGTIRKEWPVLKTAPFSFASIALLTLGLGFGAATFLDRGQISTLREQIGTKDGQISRYRVALGIDPASKGALIELNPEELIAKAQSTVAKLRTFADDADMRLASLKAIEDQKKNLSGFQRGKDMSDAIAKVSQEFDETLASDAYNVDDELKKRLDASAITYVVQVPRIKANGDRTGISIASLTRGMGNDIFFIRKLADEIEQMSKLLPTNR